MKCDRRGFLASSALALIGRRSFAASEPNAQFPSDPRDRVAVASYPFREQKIPLTDFGRMVVERLNVHGIEPLGGHFRSTDARYLAEFRSANKNAGVRVVNIPAEIGASVYDPDASKRAVAVKNGKKWIDAAAALGSPSVRLHIQGDSPDADRAAKTLKAIADYGAGRNVVVHLENDDPRTEDAFFIVRVIEKANTPWLRALPDFCNSMLKGGARHNYEAVTAMFRHAYGISHVKDSEWDNGKEYRVDVARTFGIAKAAGYRGFFSMEFEGRGDPWDGTRKLIDAALKNLA